MISVIIPTMLMSSYDDFKYSISEMQKSNTVGQIVIINNSKYDDIVKELSLCDISKLNIINCSGNIGVNPAWNLGIQHSKSFSHYAIVNDDVLCDSIVYDKCSYILDSNNEIGLVTVNTSHESLNVYKSKNNNIDVKTSRNIPNNGRIGWFMCGRITEWVYIPPELKIFYGDDVIYANIKKNNKYPVIISNYFISHKTSTTTNSDDFSKFLYSELPVWQHYIKGLKNEC